jgi:OFA family oxalate/formate antiporter-like MFS transporter
MVIAGYGGGAMVLDRIVQWLFASGHDTFRVFGIIGVVYGGLVTILSLLLFTPTKVSLHEADRRIPVVDLLRDRSFLRLAMGMFCGTFAGMMVVGNVKSIGLSYGTTATVAAYSILAFAIGNATGRVSWGFIADRIGHRTIPLSLGFSTLAVAALVPLGGSSAFAYVAALVAFGFGANFVIYATEVAQRYGADAVGSVYPIVVVFYGLSSFAGPALGGKLYDTTGSYTASIITAAAVTALGILLTRLLVVTEPSLPSGAIDPGDLDEPEYSDIGVV